MLSAVNAISSNQDRLQLHQSEPRHPHKGLPFQTLLGGSQTGTSSRLQTGTDRTVAGQQLSAGQAQYMSAHLLDKFSGSAAPATVSSGLVELRKECTNDAVSSENENAQRMALVVRSARRELVFSACGLNLLKLQTFPASLLACLREKR